ncbi:MAG: SDR family oxidoreductase [bacterium]
MNQPDYSRKKLLITGLTGKIGHILAPVLRKRFDLAGIVHHRQAETKRNVICQGSLTDYDFLSRFIDLVEPDFLLHLGALSRAGACEEFPELAEQVNVEATANLAALAGRRGIRMVFTSTDMVFDGKKGGYSEQDNPTPLSRYAKTKVAAEKRLAETGQNFLILRLALNYGPCRPDNPSFFYQVYRNLLNRRPTTLFTDEIRNMLYTPDLAPLIQEALEQGITGLYHVGGPQAVSRYDFGRELCRQLGADEKYLIPSPITGRHRPPDLSLNLEKLGKTFPRIKFKTPGEGIADFIEKTGVTASLSPSGRGLE